MEIACSRLYAWFKQVIILSFYSFLQENDCKITNETFERNSERQGTVIFEVDEGKEAPKHAFNKVDRW